MEAKNPETVEVPVEQPTITFTYRNWRGEVAERTVRPLRFWRGSTEWHPEEQVFLQAHDVERGVVRDFAVRDIIFDPAALTERDKRIGELEAVVREVDGCFQAALCEGLNERLAEADGDVGSLKDLVERRLLFAGEAAAALLSAAEKDKAQ